MAPIGRLPYRIGRNLGSPLYDLEGSLFLFARVCIKASRSQQSGLTLRRRPHPHYVRSRIEEIPMAASTAALREDKPRKRGAAEKERRKRPDVRVFNEKWHKSSAAAAADSSRCSAPSSFVCIYTLIYANVGRTTRYTRG